MKTEKATFGAGCFWHVQHEFSKINGVIKATVGYMGGTLKNPSYEDVCTNNTGHAEVCLVEFDPKIVSYKIILEEFWKMHDPTQVNKQGPDTGTQYRSAIFYYNEEQKNLAEKSKQIEQKNHKEEIATEIISSKEFYKAEEYHQDYFKKHKVKACLSGVLKK